MKMQCSVAVAATLAVLLLAQTAHGCVHMMHAGPRHLQEGKGTPWDYDFRGDDWVGKDATGKPWVCTTGKSQSPIQLEPRGLTKAPSTVRTTWSYTPLKSDGKNVQIYNNGYAVQIQWTEGALQSDVQIPAKNNILDVVTESNSDISMFKRVKATPLQAHFHIESEHILGGVHYPLEMHIVHRVTGLDNCTTEKPCLSVTGIMMELDPEDKDNAALNAIWDNMPFVGGDMVDMPANQTLDIEALLPKSREYALYSGSLTTPPCSEGLLWHVFTEPIFISYNQLKKYYLAMGPKKCDGEEAAQSVGRRMLSTSGTDMDAFVKASYSGFRRVALEENTATRNLLQSSCQAEAYGVTFRNPQELNGREVFVVSA